MVRIAAIREEHIEGFHEALDRVAREREYLNRFEAPPLESTREFVLRNIREGVAQFVALDRGRVVGWCDVSPDRHPATAHTGYLGIGLLPEYRGRGIGRRLISACLRKAKENGLERVDLSVNGSNVRARALYERVGFRLEGVRRKAAKYDGRYEDELMMALFLDEVDPCHAPGRVDKAARPGAGVHEARGWQRPRQQSVSTTANTAVLSTSKWRSSTWSSLTTCSRTPTFRSLGSARICPS